jgi:hypothetical protein
MSPLTLWSDAARTRFFLIPDQHQLPPGDLPLHTLTGRKLAVDPAAATSFEVSEEKAKEWLESQFGGLLDSARGAVERWVDRLAGADEDPLAPVRNAIQNLESVLNRYISSHQFEMESDSHALRECEERVRATAERIRKLTGD